MSTVRTEQLTKVYGKGVTAVTALDHLNIDIQPGEFVAVMGPSGCGKSTLLHLIGGLDQPTSGRVLLDGQDISGLKDDALTQLRRCQIGFVFQFLQLYRCHSQLSVILAKVGIQAKVEDGYPRKRV